MKRRVSKDGIESMSFETVLLRVYESETVFDFLQTCFLFSHFELFSFMFLSDFSAIPLSFIHKIARYLPLKTDASVSKTHLKNQRTIKSKQLLRIVFLFSQLQMYRLLPVEARIKFDKKCLLSDRSLSGELLFPKGIFQ